MHPSLPLVFHHHWLSVSFLLCRGTWHKHKNVSHAYLQPLLEILMSIHPSAHRSNSGCIFILHSYHRHQNNAYYLRLLTSSQTVALHRPLLSSLRKPRKIYRNLNKNLHCIFYSVLPFTHAVSSSN